MLEDVRSMERLGLACESADLAPIVARFAASRTSAPAPTTLSELALVFVFAIAAAAKPRVEFENSERFADQIRSRA